MQSIRRENIIPVPMRGGVRPARSTSQRQRMFLPGWEARLGWAASGPRSRQLQVGIRLLLARHGVHVLLGDLRQDGRGGEQLQ